MIIAVFPGQGSQSPGFLTPWLALDGAADRIAAYSEWAGVDLAAAGTEWDADRIRDTAGGAAAHRGGEPALLERPAATAIASPASPATRSASSRPRRPPAS